MSSYCRDASQTFAKASPMITCSVVAMLVFCQCGSDRVDIKLWNGARPQIRCLTCGREAWLDGFTLSEFEPGKLLVDALVDQARKHRKRSADEMQRIVAARNRG